MRRRFVIAAAVAVVGTSAAAAVSLLRDGDRPGEQDPAAVTTHYVQTTSKGTIYKCASSGEYVTCSTGFTVQGIARTARTP